MDRGSRGGEPADETGGTGTRIVEGVHGTLRATCSPAGPHEFFARPTPSCLMRVFTLVRHVDETGVSGTGRVAQGVEFDNGWCAMTWLTEHASIAFYPSLDVVRRIHGHNGKTSIVAGPPCP